MCRPNKSRSRVVFTFLKSFYCVVRNNLFPDPSPAKHMESAASCFSFYTFFYGGQQGQTYFNCLMHLSLQKRCKLTNTSLNKIERDEVQASTHTNIYLITKCAANREATQCTTDGKPRNHMQTTNSCLKPVT